MAELKTGTEPGRRIHGASAKAIQTTRAEKAGPKFEWHYGRVTHVGSFCDVGVDREVTIVWEEGGAASQQGATRSGRYSGSRS